MTNKEATRFLTGRQSSAQSTSWHVPARSESTGIPASRRHGDIPMSSTSDLMQENRSFDHISERCRRRASAIASDPGPDSGHRQQNSLVPADPEPRAQRSRPSASVAPSISTARALEYMRVTGPRNLAGCTWWRRSSRMARYKRAHSLGYFTERDLPSSSPMANASGLRRLPLLVPRRHNPNRVFL